MALDIQKGKYGVWILEKGIKTIKSIKSEEADNNNPDGSFDGFDTFDGSFNDAPKNMDTQKVSLGKPAADWPAIFRSNEQGGSDAHNIF